jgi:hypothetical protein
MSNVAVYGDLTALYSMRSRQRRGINYKELDSAIKSHLEVEQFEDNKWFSIYADNNEKQVSFIKGLRDIGWNVETSSTRDIRRVRDSKEYRFDAKIAVELGLAADQFEAVAVVSDSYELYAPMKRLHEEDANVQIYLVCFADGLDPRWVKHFHNEDEKWVTLVDLDLEDKI